VQDTKQSLSRLLTASPAIIYTTRASGDFACTFVSENIQMIMGFSPEQMITDPKCWPDRLHPQYADVDAILPDYNRDCAYLF
jgi:hypothetical protein